MERLAVHAFGYGSELAATGQTRQGTRFLEVVGVGVSSGSARPATGASPSFRNMRQPTLDQADAEGVTKSRMRISYGREGRLPDNQDFCGVRRFDEPQLHAPVISCVTDSVTDH